MRVLVQLVTTVLNYTIRSRLAELALDERFCRESSRRNFRGPQATKVRLGASTKSVKTGAYQKRNG
jgi:hypothetical protein